MWTLVDMFEDLGLGFDHTGHGPHGGMISSQSNKRQQTMYSRNRMTQQARENADTLCCYV